MKDDILEEISSGYIEEAKRKNVSIEEDVKTLKNTIDMDIRENMPPQLLSIVSGIVSLIEKLEGNTNEDKKN